MSEDYRFAPPFESNIEGDMSSMTDDEITETFKDRIPEIYPGAFEKFSSVYNRTQAFKQFLSE